MEQYYILILVLLNGFGMAWHYLRLSRMSERKINSDYSICQLPATLHWTQFVIPALFISIGFYGGVNLFFLSSGVALFISTMTEWLMAKKYVADAYLISGDTLIQNDYKARTFNLQALNFIDFSPFTDTLKLQFENKKTISIHRPDFDNDSLRSFIKAAIEKSNDVVVISDDARSKIYALAQF